MCYTYILNMRSVQASLLEISCLQGFINLTPVDPKWLLTSTKNNRLLVLIVVHLHTKYEICPSYPSWDIVFTSRRHDTHTYIHTYIHTHASMIAKVTIIIETKNVLRFWDVICMFFQVSAILSMYNNNYDVRTKVTKCSGYFLIWQKLHSKCLTSGDPGWPLILTWNSIYFTSTYQIWDLSKLPFGNYWTVHTCQHDDNCHQYHKETSANKKPV